MYYTVGIHCWYPVNNEKVVMTFKNGIVSVYRFLKKNVFPWFRNLNGISLLLLNLMPASN